MNSGQPRLKVVEESSTGGNEKFEDTVTGEILTREQVIENIDKYSDYQVFTRNGKQFIRSMPDFNPDNNLE
ncbi:hypothetical protein BHU72_14445 [Desulfuribacillus stibiiarsenatis]|uniref:DUF3892 domain-containing protein n=1 Tax=Desulfuribacillus stibiiarsenatis TaxID=1390249 RepID=A0A1E5L7T8_9FIRM|nr:DUF3892 domain-containing protein [Desulfuribacillus stibiiarsenatis]OEH86118.1 hypothetical protein BHU72_14445 [Desulfuribacillus stibiiarsenatis]